MKTNETWLAVQQTENINRCNTSLILQILAQKNIQQSEGSITNHNTYVPQLRRQNSSQLDTYVIERENTLNYIAT